MSYELLTLKTNQLNNAIITKICKLKNTHWRHNLDNQKKFFYSNSKKLDHHNLLYCKSKLVGYTMLRRRKLYKKKRYLLFDTLIIHKNFRSKGLAKKIMEFNNFTIKKLNLISILYCQLLVLQVPHAYNQVLASLLLLFRQYSRDAFLRLNQ